VGECGCSASPVDGHGAVALISGFGVATSLLAIAGRNVRGDRHGTAVGVVGLFGNSEAKSDYIRLERHGVGSCVKVED
jgi:hypothetical protein